MTTTTLTGSMLKYCKAVAAASLVAAFSLCGSKAFGAGPGFLGNLASPTTIDISNTVYGAGSVFNDVYSFTVQSDSSLASVLASVNFYNIVGITNFGSSLWSGSNLLATGVTDTFGPFTTSRITYSPLLAGPPAVIYEFHATGTVVGPLGSYGGAMATSPITAPVPEPEIYAMLGVGLGLLGWVGRRKKLTKAAAA